MKERNKEIRCSCCNTLLARGTAYSDNNKLSFQNFHVRDKNAKVQNIDFDYRKVIPGQYDDQVVTIETELNISFLCRKCGTKNAGKIYGYMRDSYC